MFKRIGNGVDVAGTATMTLILEPRHRDLVETSRGAQINIVANNKAAMDAVHEFLRFQIEDHQTGDCPMQSHFPGHT